MKKLVVIFSFVLISVFSAGSYFLHQLYLKNYKKEFKSYIKTHKNTTAFSTITIYPSELYTNSKNIIWEDENKEVIYKGILYDVVSINSKGLTVELTVVSDHQEMKLKKEFASLYDVSSSEKTKGPFDLLKTFFALKYIVHTDYFNIHNVVIEKNLFFASPIFFITNKTILQDGPPPDFSV